MNTIAIIHQEAVKVIGPSLDTSFREGRHEREIPPFFHRVLADGRLDILSGGPKDRRVCVFAMKGESPDFTYLMGVEAGDDADVPEDMDCMVLPAGDYARLTTIKQGPKDVGTAFARVHQEWLPTSAYRAVDGPAFILYDDRFFSVFDREGYAGKPVVDLYIPVQAR